MRICDRLAQSLKARLPSDPQLSGTYTIVAGDAAKLEVNGDSSFGVARTTDIQSGKLIFNGGLDSEIEDIGSAEVIMAGHSNGSMHLMGVYLERNGASPNMRITKPDQTLIIEPYDMNAPFSADYLTLNDNDFELTDGTYAVGTVTLESGSLDLNHSFTFEENLNLAGGYAEQSNDSSVVIVQGDFSSGLEEGIFCGGTLKVAGDFTNNRSNSFLETGSHVTVMNGTAAQTISMNWEGNHFNILELGNTSEGGVTFNDDTYMDQLFDHRRNNFTLEVADEDRFADYDGDGVKDHLDPYPKDAGKSFIDFTILAVPDQIYTGDPLEPELTVTDEEGRVLAPKEDYEVSFTDNTLPGIATASVTGRGFHSTSREEKFIIICHHSWGGWEIVKMPTTEEAGSRERTCELCGEKEMESIPMLKAVLNLPADLTEIESEAFSGLTSADAVRIPKTVTEIADDAFEGSDIVIIAPEGCYAVHWAEDHDVLCVIE